MITCLQSAQVTKKVGCLGNQLFLFLSVSLVLFSLSVSVYTTSAYAEQSLPQSQALQATAIQAHQDIKPIQKTQQVEKTKKTSTIFNATELKKLAKHKQWQHLLFYKNGRAEVISPNFYLSDPQSRHKKKFSPYQELVATIKQSNNPTTLCKYPARYYWLSQHLPKLPIDLSKCTELPSPKQDISLILVSSYLKNPASTFGHVLIKTNDSKSLNNTNTSKNVSKSIQKQNQNHKQQLATQVHAVSSQDLLNQSYNFGARIPNNENGVLYALKGLFGFYDAGFSKADFFKQDAVYAKNEQRDMWEYVLNLDEFNTALLNYHLYEAQSARFTYYFIKQNCGYRSGEILELVSDIETTNRIGGWYAPDFVFDQLVEYKATDHSQNHFIDTANQQARSLIKQTRYLPSEQTQLRQRFEQLPANLQTIINDFIKHADMQALAQLDKQQQALVIDFLLSHRNYQLSQADNEDKASHEKIKKQLISKRFTLPVGNELAKLPLTVKPSPALSNKTTRTAVSVSDKAVNAGLTLFVKDPLNDYNDLNKRFEAVKLSASYRFDEDKLNGNLNDNLNDKLRDGKLQFDEFVFLDMQQVENLKQPLAGEPKMAWQLKTGVQPDPVEGTGHITYAQAGVGTGLELLSSARYDALGYGFVNAHVHDQKGEGDIGYLDVSSQLGVRLKDNNNSRAGQLEYSVRKRDGSHLVQRDRALTKIMIYERLYRM